MLQDRERPYTPDHSQFANNCSNIKANFHIKGVCSVVADRWKVLVILVVVVADVAVLTVGVDVIVVVMAVEVAAVVVVVAEVVTVAIVVVVVVVVNALWLLITNLNCF
jgi:hypothetical protein